MSRRQDSTKRASIREIKDAACGQWNDILQDAGLPMDCLDNRGWPCPLCGGDDRYNAATDVNDTGAVFCRRCFNKSSKISPSDGIATVSWLRETTNREAADWVAERLGLIRDDENASIVESVNIIDAVCSDKRMPIDAFKRFGVKNAMRGRNRYSVARVDVYNAAGTVHSHFDLWPGDKGKFKHGKGSSGMFFPGRLPQPGETWLLVEGVKDAAALVGLGFNAAGMPTNKLAAKYAGLFAGVDVVIIHDLDTAGVSGSEYSAGNLAGIASSVAVARLPGQLKERQGADVRDVLRIPNGEGLVRNAIESATAWKPSSVNDHADERPELFITMNEAEVTEQVVRYLGRLGWDSPWIKPVVRDHVQVFVRGGVLVHAVESDEVGAGGRLTVRDMPSCIVRERITQACNLLIEKEVHDDIEVLAARPPGWLIDAVYRRGTYGGAVRPLSGIIESPTIRVDGSILQSPGYDPETSLIFRPTVNFPTVPESPANELRSLETKNRRWIGNPRIRGA
ncbi:primase-helicase zinc-binding domain-containing protein [Planctomycetota bacterium]